MLSHGAMFVRMVLPYDLLFAYVKCFSILIAEVSTFHIDGAQVLESTNEVAWTKIECVFGILQ